MLWEPYGKMEMKDFLMKNIAWPTDSFYKWRLRRERVRLYWKERER